MRLDESLRRYETNARARGYSPSTITHVKRCVSFFADFLGGVQDINRVGADDLRRFLSNLRDSPIHRRLIHERERKLSPTSINTYARAVKSFWGWLEREGIIKKNPLASVQTPKKGKTIPRVYSEDELKAVLNAVSSAPRDRAIVELLLDSGIRLAELASLKVGDVELRNGRIRVFGKGSKERFAYFSQPTAESINYYLKEIRPEPAEEDYLFLTKEGYRLSGRRIQVILERAGRRSSIRQRLSAHKLRHTYATLALKYGNNLEYVRITLGHTDVKTTSQSYLNVADNDIATAYQKFSPVTNLLIARQKEPSSVEDRWIAVQGVHESEIRLTFKPTPGEPLPVPVRTCDDFKINIKANEVLIESIQVFTTDPEIEYRLFLFEVNPPDDPLDWDNEDIIQVDSIKKRIYTYSPNPAIAYKDYDNSNKVHAGICIGQRPLRFDLFDDKQKAAYYEAPVSYTITLRYRTLMIV